ncbi:MAG TPA: MmgE/PrpD family protein [Candidatus Acidoferrales bacterium]|nr:MmgE/PrpD family protein [Candidatus Acidoferrales bacterium]
MARPPVTERFAAFVAETDYSALSPNAIRNAKLHILDTLGVALAGYEHPVAEIVLDYCRFVGGTAHVTVIGSKERTSVPAGAFANGLLAHAIDYDDWDAVARVGHPSCQVVAAALATGEARGASGKDLLGAYAVGIEIATQIAAACPDIIKRGFHSTPIYGSIGAAAAAASTLRLKSSQVRAAFGIAASAAGGLFRQQGSMVKPFHAGNGARNGVEAALLAQRGFTADEAIIENPIGFCDTFFFGDDTCDYEKMLQGLGNPFYVDSPGLSFKLHPCSAPQFLAADATLHLVRQHNIRFEDIERVELRLNPFRYDWHYRPSVQSGLQAKFTTNYVCAVAILDGRLDRSSFSDAKTREPKVLEAMSKVSVIRDETIPEQGEYCPVAVELKDGRKVQYTATIQRGHAKNPLTEDEVLEKFRSNAAVRIPHGQAEEVIACVRGLEKLASLRELTKLLVP